MAFSALRNVSESIKGLFVQTPPMDLSEYQKRNFDIVLSIRNNRHYMYIPELGIIVDGSSANEALAALESAKDTYFKRVIAANAHGMVPEPGMLVPASRFFREITMFGLKATLVTVLGAVFVSVFMQLFNVIIIKKMILWLNQANAIMKTM